MVVDDRTAHDDGIGFTAIHSQFGVEGAHLAVGRSHILFARRFEALALVGPAMLAGLGLGPGIFGIAVGLGVGRLILPVTDDQVIGFAGSLVITDVVLILHVFPEEANELIRIQQSAAVLIRVR